MKNNLQKYSTSHLIHLDLLLRKDDLMKKFKKKGIIHLVNLVFRYFVFFIFELKPTKKRFINGKPEFGRKKGKRPNTINTENKMSKGDI